MKQQIDNLVRAIHHARTCPLPADPHLAEFFLARGLDGPAMAVRLRDALERHVKDGCLAAEVCQYARQQLEGLPEF